MSKQVFNINNLHVASPCSVGWETMTGDERVRHCHSCKLNIYNIAEMTSKEVEDLIEKRENRICIRLYRRADGTVLIKDCPVGFRAYRKKATRLAGAALATIFGLFSVSFGQNEYKKSVDASKVKIVKTINQTKESVLSGVISDSTGAVISGVKLKLFKKDSKKHLRGSSDADGSYVFTKLIAGSYRLEAKAKGFTLLIVTGLEVKTGEELSIDIELQPANTNITVGIYAGEPLIDTNSSSITTRITREMLDKLPY